MPCRPESEPNRQTIVSFACSTPSVPISYSIENLSIWSPAADAVVVVTTENPTASSSPARASRIAAQCPSHQRPRRVRVARARCASRSASRCAMDWRLSYSRLPVAMAISTLAYPSVK